MKIVLFLALLVLFVIVSEANVINLGAKLIRAVGVNPSKPACATDDRGNYNCRPVSILTLPDWQNQTKPGYQIESLPKFNVDPNETSISGISSGGFFAAQVQVAHSSLFKGAGIIAGGLYDCFRHVRSKDECRNNNNPSVWPSINQTNQWSGNLIDDTSNLRRHRVYMLAETNDPLINVGPMLALYDFYVTHGHYIPEQNVKLEIGEGWGHIFPTDNNAYGNIPCDETRDIFVANCGYDGAGAILNQIYSDLKPRVKQRTGKLIKFDQAEFLSNPNAYGLDTAGYAYIPRACSAGEKCRLHVVIHGCFMGYFFTELRFIENTGYDVWADSNNIILVFPQTYSSSNAPSLTIITGEHFTNNIGCWDYSAMYDKLYDTKRGIQINFIKNIIDRIVSNP